MTEATNNSRAIIAMRSLLLGIFIAASLMPLSCFAAPPASVEARYELYRNNILFAQVRETFAQSSGAYQIESTGSPAGIASLLTKEHITRSSKGAVTAKGLRPEFFEERRVSASKEKIRSARFNWSEKKITLTFDDKTETVPLRPGTQDWGSFFYQFLFGAPKKDRVKLTLTDGRRVEDYEYRFSDETTIATALGKLQTLHYVYTDPKGGKSAEMWLAKKKSFFPVKLIQVEDGITLEQRLVELNLR